MTHAELIDEVAAASEITKKQAAEILMALAKRMTATLMSGQDVILQGIGKFTVKATAARKVGMNPATKKPYDVPAGKKVAFRIHKSLKDAVKAG